MSGNRASETEEDDKKPGVRYSEFVASVLTGETKIPSVSCMTRHLNSACPGIFRRNHCALSLYYIAELIIRLVATGYFIALSINHEVWWLACLFILLQGVNLFGLVAIVHDLAHGNLLMKSKLNEYLGLLISPAMLIRFYAFRSSHLRHHKFNQTPLDPKTGSLVEDDEALNLLGFLVQGVYKKAYLRAPTLAKNALIAVTMLTLTLPIMLFNYEFSPFKKVRSRRDVIEVSTFTLFWIAALLSLGWEVVLFAMVIPMFIAAPMVGSIFMTHASEWSLFPVEHRRSDHELMIFNIADLSWGPVLDRLGYYFSAQHVAHHFFPSLPFFRLEAAAVFLEREYGAYKFPTQRLSMRYLRECAITTLLGTQRIEIAGRTFDISPRFMSIRMPGGAS